jgi:hypothetical protein
MAASMAAVVISLTGNTCKGLYLSLLYRVSSLPASTILSCQVEEQRVNQPLIEPVNLTFVLNEQVIH